MENQDFLSLLIYYVEEECDYKACTVQRERKMRESGNASSPVPSEANLLPSARPRPPCSRMCTLFSVRIPAEGRGRKEEGVGEEHMCEQVGKKIVRVCTYAVIAQ